MPGSGQVEQVTVRFQVDINQYIQAMAQAKKAIEAFAAGADSTTAKAMKASVAAAQQYSKLAQESGKLAVAQAKVASATDQAATSQGNLNSQTVKSASSTASMSSALRSVIGQYVSLGVAISQVSNVVREGLDFNKFMEVSTTAFGVMMKSVDQAKSKMEELFNYAVNSPLTFKETVSASRQLMAYGFTAEQLIPTINTLGTVAKATGVQLGDMAYVYGTLKSQGRAYTRDLMQFAMRGIPIYEELAKVVGKPVGELQKMTEAGAIGFREVETAFKNMTTEGGRFAGFFDEYMKTFEGKMSMLSDVWQQATGKLTKGLFESLKPMMDDLTYSLKKNGDAFETWGKIIGGVVKTLFALKEALAVLAIGALIVKISALVAAAGSIGAALMGIVAAVGGPVTIAIAGLVAGIAALFGYIRAESAKLAAELAKEMAPIMESEDRRRRGVSGEWKSRAAMTESITSPSQEEIDKLEKTEAEVKKFAQHRELFGWLVATGLLLVMTEIVLGQTVWRRLP